MKQINRALKFIIPIILLQFILNFLFTINGYSNIYNYVYDRSIANSDEIGKNIFFDKVFENTTTKTIYSSKLIENNNLNYEYLIDVIEYLHKTEDLKYIVLDIPYSEAEILNNYMNNSPDLLSDFINTISIDEYRSNEFRDFVNNIRDINLISEDIIQFVGILPEIKYDNTYNYIKMLISTIRNANVSDKVKGYIFNDNLLPEVYLDSLKDNYKKYPALYKECFLKNFFSLEMIFDNYKPDINARPEKNFCDIYNHNLRAKYFIINTSNIISQIVEFDSSLEKKIFQNTILYMNAWNQEPEYLYSYNVNAFTDAQSEIIYYDNRIIKYFEKYREKIYMLNGKPFYSYDEDIDDYLIIIKNSQSLTYPENNNA